MALQTMCRFRKDKDQCALTVPTIVEALKVAAVSMQALDSAVAVAKAYKAPKA